MTDQEARDELRDSVAVALCRIEGRRTGRSLDEVVAPGIELWIRHRDEAERLIEELLPIFQASGYRKHPEAGWEWGTALRAADGSLWDCEPDSKPHAFAHVAECDVSDHSDGESCVVVRRAVIRGSWEQVL